MELYHVLVLCGLFLGAISEDVEEENSLPSFPRDIPSRLLKVAGILESKQFHMVYAIGANSTDGFGDFAIIPGSEPLDIGGAKVQPLFIRVKVIKMNESQIDEITRYVSSKKSEIQSKNVEKFNLTEEANGDTESQEDDSSNDNEISKSPSTSFNIFATINDDEGKPVLKFETDSDDSPIPILPIPIPPELVPPKVHSALPHHPQHYDSYNNRPTSDTDDTPPWEHLTMMFYLFLMVGFIIFTVFTCFNRFCCVCPDDFEDFDTDSFRSFVRAKSSNGFKKKSQRYPSYERI